MKIEPAAHLPALADLGRVHLIGIGGAGLSAIARLLNQQDVRVQGSDAKDSALLAELRAEGITCFVGHDAEHLAAIDTVIASTAVRRDNPEIVEAQRRGLRLWPRSSGLAVTMQDDRRVAVAGTHGKTTTTAMLACALRGSGLDPSFAIGATVPALGTNARRGTDQVMIVEADESDGAFLHYAPVIGVVTNVDADHLDVYGSPEAYDAAFDEFAQTVSETLVVCADDPGARRMAARADHDVRVVLAGFEPGADVLGSRFEVVATSAGARTRFEVAAGDHQMPCELAVPGIHYARDALLAIAAGLELGFELADLVAGLAAYTGADRRMQPVGEAGGVTVVDSYAHHPAEIKADLAAARHWAGDRRLVVAFQPHLVSRTRVFGEQMAHALSAADVVAIADVYLAREDPDPSVTSEKVAAAVEGEAVLTGPISATPAALAQMVRPGDFVLTLGAGDITEVGPRLLELIRDGR